MTNARRSGYGWRAWGIGFAVLAALGAAVAMMFHHTLRSADSSARLDRVQVAGPSSEAGVDGAADAALYRLASGGAESSPIQQLEVRQRMAKDLAGEVIRGVVRHPDGREVSTATVTLYRVLTAWPEWRTEEVDEALTDESGAFQFRVPARHGHLVGFEHPRFAGDLVEVPLQRGDMQLQLRPRFEVYGHVVNDSGVPVANARVVLEAVPGEPRRARVTTTSADGSYQFGNLAAGPARLVAHHESWQPTSAPAIVVGDRELVDLRFERPTMSPLRGRVVSAITQQGIAGAGVQLVPINQELGLIEPVEVTTDADGNFLLEGLPRGGMRLFVRHPEHGAVQRTHTIGAVAQDVTIEMPLRSVVYGALSEARDGAAWRGGEVLELTDIAGELRYANVSGDGSFRFDGAVSPGWATLRAIGREFAFRRTSLPSVSVLVREDDETELDLTVVSPSVVRGRFVDEQGAPVAGVRVLQTRQLTESARRIGDAAWQMDIGAVGSQFARLFGSERDQLLAVSDDDGRFEIRGVRVGGLLARCVRSGYGSRLLNLSVPSTGQARTFDDTLLRGGCAISGVVLRGSRPFAGASVAAIGADCQGIAVTDRSGRYVIRDLVPGSYSVRARITGQSTGGDEEVVTVAPDQPARGVNIRLEIGRTVTGVVTSVGGQPLPGAIVSMRGARGLVAATDSVGRFSLDVPNRAVELRVSLGDRSRHTIVTVAPGQRSVEVQLDTPPKCTLRGSVFGLPGQRRMLGALLRVTPLDDEDDERTTRWVEMPDGELEWHLCPSGTVRVEIWCDGYAPFVTERALLPNEPHDLGQVLLEPGARLAGVVRDGDGAPVADATVLLGEEGDLDLYQPAVRSDAEGRFVLHGVTSRSSQLVVRAPGFAASTTDVQLPRDVLSSTPLEVRLERGATIEVHAPTRADSDPGLVQLRRRGRLLATGEFDERGRVWFANRSAGDYTVELFGSEREPQPVRVAPGAKLVRVELLLGNE